MGEISAVKALEMVWRTPSGVSKLPRGGSVQKRICKHTLVSGRNQPYDCDISGRLLI